MKINSKLKNVLLAVSFGIGLSGVFVGQSMAGISCSSNCDNLADRCEAGYQTACAAYARICRGCL